MLSPNSTLCQNRYLIVKNLWVESPQKTYFARDTHTDLGVVIADIGERNLDPLADLGPQHLLAHLKSFTHPSLIGIRDYFSESGNHYLVTRPVSGTSLSHFLGSPETGFSINEIESGLRELTAAMSVVAESAKGVPIGLSQANIWVSSENEFKLLYFGSFNESSAQIDGSTEGPRSDFAFQPLEKIWGRLDRASQTTIANTYDDGSLDVLESPPDLRADMFSLGALFYRLLTGRMPFDALERSIEILDGNHDPLFPPNHSNAEVQVDVSEFVMKLMRLRRENRFETFDSASRHLNVFVPERKRPSVFLKEQAEELDVLEIPGYSHSFNTHPSSFALPKTVDFTASPVQAEDGNIEQLADDRFYATEILLPLVAQDAAPAALISEPRPKPWFLSPIAAVIIIAVLVTGSVIAYLAVGAASSDALPTHSELKPTVMSDHPAKPESVAVPVSTQIPAGTSTFESSINTQTSELSKEKLSANPVPPTQARSRMQVADAKLPSKPDRASSDPSKAKKKVTVDDLINDN